LNFFSFQMLFLAKFGKLLLQMTNILAKKKNSSPGAKKKKKKNTGNTYITGKRNCSTTITKLKTKDPQLRKREDPEAQDT